MWLFRRKPLIIRRIVGTSMEPSLKSRQLIIASGWFGAVHPGQVIIISHDGKEKIKRIERIDDDKRQVFIIGDNLARSSDSRHFGWLDYANIVAKVIYPNRNLHK